MYSSTHYYAKALETEGVLGKLLPYILPLQGKKAFKSNVSKARTLQRSKGAKKFVFVLKVLFS